MENYTDENALNRHLESDLIKSTLPEIEPLLTKPFEISICDALSDQLEK